MAIYSDSNVYLHWVEGELPASRILLSPCVIGPRVDVYEQEAVNGVYVANPDSTEWVEFDLPNFEPQYHKPVDYSFLNECNQTWISPLEALYIQDSVDGVTYTIDSEYYLFDYGQGIISLHPDITYNIGSFEGLVNEVYETNIDGTAAVAGTIKMDQDSTFPYLLVNGNQTRVRTEDIIELPYVFVDKFTNDAGLAHRIYSNTSGSTNATSITSIDEANNQIVFDDDIGDPSSYVCVICRDGDQILYILGTIDGTDQKQINNARIGGSEDLVHAFDNFSAMTFDEIAVFYVPDESDFTLTWQTAHVPDDSGDGACVIDDLIEIFYVRTIAISEDSSYTNYESKYYSKYGIVTDHDEGTRQTTYTLHGTGGNIDTLGDDDKLVFITYAAAWVVNSGTDIKLCRRVEPDESFCDGGERPAIGSFFYVLLSTTNEQFTNTNIIPLGLYNQGANYLCTACEVGETYLWGFLLDDIPTPTPGTAEVLSVDINLVGQNAVSAYIPQYSAIYVVNYGFYDIAPLQYTDGIITSTNNNELTFYILSDAGEYALPPAEVQYEFTYNIYRPLNGTPKVTYMVFNSYQPNEPIEITTYNDILNNLGNIHPYNPLAYAAYLMYQNRSNNTNTITFFAIPINSQDINGYANAVEILRAYKSENNVLYELAALTFSSQVHALIQGFVEERSTPRWSDYRRYWKAVCPLPSYISKVSLGTYNIGANANVLQDFNNDFYSLNVQEGDYVETIPSTIYKTLSNSTIAISANAAGFILTHSDLETENNIVGKYIYFTDSNNTTWTGKIARKLTSTSVWIELDSSPNSIISEANVDVYIFRYWAKFRVVSVDSKVTVTVDGNLPVSPLIYRLYSQYSKEDIAEHWYAQAKQDNSERVMIVNPWIRTTWENTTYVLPGFYLAAAKAAQAGAKENISEPLSGWPLQGIDYVEYSDEFFGPDLFQEIYQNGIDIHMNQSPNGPVISWRQRTTAQDITIQGKHEQSVVKVVDYLAHIFKNSVEPLTKKYNISTKVAEHINVALQTIIRNAKTGPKAIIEPSSRLVSIIPIRQPSDLPSSFQMANDIPFETGYYIKTFIVHKSPVYRIQHEMFISQTEEES